MKQLYTRWSKEVMEHPDEVWQEYPRPAMVRESYVNLNGKWDYAITEDKKKIEAYDGQILVPFSPESLLSGVNRQLQPNQYLWYRRFLPEEVKKEAGKRWILHFGAVDQFAAVYLNGNLVCKHLGGYLPFSVDVTECIKEPVGGMDAQEDSGSDVKDENELIVVVRDFSDHSYYSRGKQKLERGGMFYTAQSGIWQTVWMELVPEDYIQSLKITPLYDEEMVEVVVKAEKKLPVTVNVQQGEQVTGETNTAIKIPVKNMHSWSPEDPFLYDMKVEMGEDAVESYFAMRKISVSKDRNGVAKVFLNNEPYFQKGLLDQGYWPDGLYTAPSDEALIFDITEMKRLGFNMLRKHIKIEPQRWYYHCDRLGMLVWQDMVNGGRQLKSWYVTYLATVLSHLHIHPKDFTRRLLGRQDKAGREQFIEEMKETITLLYNHPSVVTWVIFNEAWGQFDAKKVTAIAEKEDTTRLFDQASGWFDQGGGDFESIHEYFLPLKVKAKERVVALTEFGGYAWHESEHSMCENDYGYKTFHSKEELTEGYGKLIERDILPNIKKGLCVTIYTQVSDVEEEVNGIYTYDREVLKIEEEALKYWNDRMVEVSKEI